MLENTEIAVTLIAKTTWIVIGDLGNFRMLLLVITVKHTIVLYSIAGKSGEVCK